MIVVFVYISIGVLYHIWHPTWLLFLLIPLSRGITAAVQYKNWLLLPYPILIVALYFALGTLFNAWHIAWVLFLTIPLYFSLLNYYRKQKEYPNNDN